MGKKTGKKSHSRKALYAYDGFCRLTGQPVIDFLTYISGSAVLASERKLPKPSKKLIGRCVSQYPPLGRLPIGTVLDIAFGDPIVLRNCKIIVYDKKTAPLEVSESYDGRVCVTLLYKGKRVWVAKSRICKLADMLKKRK